MGLFNRNKNKNKNFKPHIDCIKPIDWLGLKVWNLQTGGFATNNNECCYIRTYPLFKTCDMLLDLTNNNEYKLVQIGTRLSELCWTMGDEVTNWSYKRLPILKLVKSDCDLSTIDSYEECKVQFINEEITNYK